MKELKVKMTGKTPVCKKFILSCLYVTGFF